MFLVIYLISCIIGFVNGFSAVSHSPSISSVTSTIDLNKYKNVSPAIDRLGKLDDGRDRSGCYAIALISGNPRWIEKGRYYDVYRIHQQVGKKIFLNRIEFFHSQAGWYVNGEPYLHNVRAVATILKHFRSPKMRTVKFRSKKHYKRTIGKRQEMTRILINDFEVFRTDVNFFTHDPVNFPLMKMQFIKFPSLELRKMKHNTVRGMTREEKGIIGDSPLDHFDPIYNKLVIREQFNNSI
ncbi:plastid 50S ribosomal protein L21 [Theileria orientalis]|uniref:Plastid 50S ribosomal protein L21 n=1 Tax=Theileria orientalis TaxID=68886 RepID=A0A976M607_THEOR|nr:plastid 50S ribosomal protein L21 [Theileria orientalis]